MIQTLFPLSSRCRPSVVPCAATPHCSEANRAVVTRSRGIALLAGLLLAACATVPVGPPEEIVRQRSSERWQALINRDFAKAYTFHTPAYRATVDAEAYRDLSNKAGWSAGEVVKVTCPEATRCLSTVRMESKSALWRKYGGVISTHDDETWTLENGQWWIQQK